MELKQLEQKNEFKNEKKVKKTERRSAIERKEKEWKWKIREKGIRCQRAFATWERENVTFYV